MFRAPSQAGLPSVSTMLDDIAQPPAKIARHLGISLSTLNRYRAAGYAPRPVMLAMFWETQWGRSTADAEAHNAALFARGEARAMKDHTQRMAGVIWRLEQEMARGVQHGGAANLPVWRVA